MEVNGVLEPKRECQGYGECLEQDFINDDCDTYKKDPRYHCEHNSTPVKCRNYDFCTHQAPKQYMKPKGRCINCDILFGDWREKVPHLSPITLQDKVEYIVDANGSELTCFFVNRMS